MLSKIPLGRFVESRNRRAGGWLAPRNALHHRLRVRPLRRPRDLLSAQSAARSADEGTRGRADAFCRVRLPMREVDVADPPSIPRRASGGKLCQRLQGSRLQPRPCKSGAPSPARADPTESRTAGPAPAVVEHDLCARRLPAETIEFAGLYPAIEERLPLSNFRAGQIVEIDPRKMTPRQARAHIEGLRALGARVSIYLVRGSLRHRRGLQELAEIRAARLDRKLALGPVRATHPQVTHPGVLAGLAQGIENGWRLGANYVRDRTSSIIRRVRPIQGFRQRCARSSTSVMTSKSVSADGTIEPERVTGLVAHNNLASWRQLIEQGRLRRPPRSSTSERPGSTGGASRFRRRHPNERRPAPARRRLGHRSRPAPRRALSNSVRGRGISRDWHDLARPGRSYELPQAYVDAVRRLSGVTEALVIPDESRYVGAGRGALGKGPEDPAEDAGFRRAKLVRRRLFSCAASGLAIKRSSTRCAFSFDGN